MLEYCAGITVFSLLLTAKYVLSKVLVYKKQVASSLVIIVTSELFILFLVYISIDKYRLSGIRIIVGFVLAAATSFAIYGMKRFLSKDEKTQN